MSQDALQPTESADDVPAARARWATALSGWMEAKGLRSADVARLTGFTSGQISAWLSADPRRGGVSVKTALRFADGLDLMPSDALRAASFDDLAQRMEDIAAGRRITRPDDDPVAARGREITKGLIPDDAEPIIRDLAADVARAIEYARLKAEEVRRQAQDDGNGLGA